MVMQNPFCEATYDGGDYVTCDRCGLQWELYDPFPPACEFEANRSVEEKQ